MLDVRSLYFYGMFSGDSVPLILLLEVTPHLYNMKDSSIGWLGNKCNFELFSKIEISPRSIGKKRHLQKFFFQNSLPYANLQMKPLSFEAFVNVAAPLFPCKR